MTRKELTQEIIKHFENKNIGISKAGSKGDGFFIQGCGFVKFEQARKMAGLEKHDEKIERQERVTAYGEFAWIAGLNNRMNG